MNWLKQFRQKHSLPSDFSHSATQAFIPFAEHLVAKCTAKTSPQFVGINGCQGSGKSTLTRFLYEYLQSHHALSVVTMSLDDYYLSRAQRTSLAENVHPLLQTRGVPGTHDTALLAHTLQSLATGCDAIIPSFNKALDEPVPKSSWAKVTTKQDIIIVEGWCWGVMPQSALALKSPVNALEASKDAGGHWRHYVNETLANAYVPLYSLVDTWLMLKAPSFDVVSSWRKQQEEDLRASQPAGSGVMTDAQIDAFVLYFQRLTEHALSSLAQRCDFVYELNEARKIVNVIHR